MHILIVFHTSFPEIRGGINTMIATLARQWMNAGHRVSIFSPGDWSDINWSEEKFAGISLYKKRLRLPWDRRSPIKGLIGWILEFPKTVGELLQLMKREKVDILHLHTPRDYQSYFRRLESLGGPPYVLTFHGTDALHFAQEKGKNFRSLHKTAKKAAALTAVSMSYARLIGERRPELGHVHYVPNGIEIKSETESAAFPNRVLEKFRKGVPEKYFVMVGWVEPPKGQDIAVRAWGILGKNHPNLHLLIIGGQSFLHPGEPHYPGFLEEIENLIHASGCGATVHLMGALEAPDVSGVLARASGLVFPSHREGLPYVLLEAALHGLPVVCNDIPAFSDILENGVHGLLTPDGDPLALAAAVERIVNDPELGKKLGKALKDHVTVHFSAERMARDYLDLFHEVLHR
ncbi:MAG: glycosyltransferase family 4 protein [Magnetococcales bacterium]|nr:glycosyltransferase family 4 protein [Magnetococcales bacterium]